MYGKEKTHKYLAVTNVDRSKKDHKIDTYSQKKNLRTVPALMIDETKVVHLKLVLPFNLSKRLIPNAYFIMI